MANSALVDYTKLSPNNSGQRNQQISKITIHHMAGNLSVETCGNVFANTAREASANYGIGTDGRVGMYVEECNRAWTSSSPDNDNRAVTIEVANDEVGGNWHVSDTSFNKLIDLCVDICKRNNFRLSYDGTPSGALTRHNMFTPTNCPGPYLQSRFDEIVRLVNARLDGNGTAPQPTPEQPQQPSDLPVNMMGQRGPTPDRKYSYEYDAGVEVLQRILCNAGAQIAVDGKAGEHTYNALQKYTVEHKDNGPLIKWVQERLNYTGYNAGYADGVADQPTMDGIARFQQHYGLGVGYLGGTDWYYIIEM